MTNIATCSDSRNGSLPPYSQFLRGHSKVSVCWCDWWALLPVCGHHTIIGDSMLYEKKETAKVQEEKTR